jgi:TP901 family phage tail tape measure protein
MPNLPQSGIELVAQGASAYIADVNKAAHATDSFTNNLSGSANRASAFGEVVTGALRRVGEVALDALGMAAKAAGQFLADSVTSAADVEQTLNVLGATSGATAAQLEEVRDVAIKLGGDLDLPNASAQDAAEAMLELSKAGFTVQESMAAAKGTLQLAAAAQIEAGEAAAITAQAINSFGLEASDAAHVADLLAGGANASSASMTDLAQGLQQGGFAFDAAGQDIDQLVVSLAALTNVGLTGSDAGTALKNAMMRLMNPTDKAAKLMNRLGIDAYDATGKMKPWPEVLENIRKATKGMTDEQRNAALGTIFLSDGMKAMIPLLDMSAAEYEALTASVSKAGSAQTVAGAQTQGFNGAIAGLQSQMETLQLIIGTKVLPLLTPLIQQFSAVAGAFGEVTMAAIDAGLGSTEFLESLGLLDQKLGLLPGTLAGVYVAIETLAMTAQTVGQAIMTGDFMTVWDTLAPMAQQGINSMLEMLVPIAASIVEKTQAWAAALGQWIIDAMPGMGSNLAAFAQDLYSQVGAALPPLVAQLATWGAEFVAWLTEAAPIFLEELGHYTADMLGYLQDNLPAIMAQLAKWGGEFVLWLLNAIPPLIAAAGDLLGKVLTWLIASLPGLGANLKKWGEAFVQWIVDAWPGMLKAFNDLDVKFTGWLRGLAERATADGSVGKAIIDGMVNGINSAISSLTAAAANAAKSALDAAKKALGISSPSQVFKMEVGYNMSAGIAEGVTAGQGLINKALASVTAPIARPSMGSSSSTVNNSRTVNYSPTYGGATKGSPTLDLAIARSLAV